MISAQASGASLCGRLSASAAVFNIDATDPSWYAWPCADETKPSRSPQIINVGSSMRARESHNRGSPESQANRAIESFEGAKQDGRSHAAGFEREQETSGIAIGEIEGFGFGGDSLYVAGPTVIENFWKTSSIFCLRRA